MTLLRTVTGEGWQLDIYTHHEIDHLSARLTIEAICSRCNEERATISSKGFPARKMIEEMLTTPDTDEQKRRHEWWCDGWRQAWHRGELPDRMWTGWLEARPDGWWQCEECRAGEHDAMDTALRATTRTRT